MGDRSRTTTVARAASLDVVPRDTDGQGQALSLCHEGGLLFAGRHLLIELWGANHLTSAPDIRRILQEAVAACRATLLNIHLHTFLPTHGISGVAVLGESHMSIHTWPEHAYAAVDIFMCGSLDPWKAVPVLKQGFRPKQVQIMDVKRGVMDGDAVVR